MNIGTPWDGAPKDAQEPEPPDLGRGGVRMCWSLRSQFREKGQSACTGETSGPGGYRGLGQDTWLEKWLDPRNLRACSPRLQTPSPAGSARQMMIRWAQPLSPVAISTSLACSPELAAVPP